MHVLGRAVAYHAKTRSQNIRSGSSDDSGRRSAGVDAVLEPGSDSPPNLASVGGHATTRKRSYRKASSSLLEITQQGTAQRQIIAVHASKVRILKCCSIQPSSPNVHVSQVCTSQIGAGKVRSF